MLMVIFGAGASYDSYPSCPPGDARFGDDRPPLAIHLFEEREPFAKIVREFPDCRPIIAELRHRDPNEGVERVLERIQAENANDPVGQREMTAVRYYLQSIIWECEERWELRHSGVTNYSRLLRQIRIHDKANETVCFVTFNYDRMLEKALPALGGNIQAMNDYINSSRYKVFKIHGSVNWRRVISNTPFELRPLSDSSVAREVIRNADYILGQKWITEDYEIATQLTEQKLKTGKQQFALFPALAIPVESKQDFELPPDHLDQLNKIIPEITKLLVIGWRATDAPFLELLAKNARLGLRVDVVCEQKKKGDEVAVNMQKAGVKGNYFTEYQGFTNFVASGKAEAFLRT
jgi:hypothetical protein